MASFDGPSIGARVTRYRRLNGWTMDELAARTAGEGVPAVGRGVIANIESGRKVDVSVAQLISLARGLQVPPVALMIDIDRMDAAGDLKVGSHRLINHGLFGWLTGHWATPDRDLDPTSKRDVERKTDALHDYLAALAKADAGPSLLDEEVASRDRLVTELAHLRSLEDPSDADLQRLGEVRDELARIEMVISRVAATWREEEVALKRLRDLGVVLGRGGADGTAADPTE